SFRAGHQGKTTDACDIAVRAIEALNEPRFDGVAAAGEYDWNGCGRSLRGQSVRIATTGRDDGDPAADKIGGHCRQPIILSLRPAILDDDVLPLGIAHLLQTPAECCH